jgi:uncharacterized spore protein YtfJ
MGSVGIIEAIRDSMVSHTDVKMLYGEPITTQGKTIIPVAKVAYGFGVGAGNARGQENAGGGGGGGVHAFPLGVIEITPERTRFISISDRKKLAAAAAAGMLFGRFLLRRFSFF